MKDFSPKRLRNLLVVFFLALAIPTGVLIWQAYEQLKWESFYQYRGMAEELTDRIDAAFNDRLNAAEARNFTDYAFLVVSGDPAANFLQRSPLSDYPVKQDLPGGIGYFQVDANGKFSTPLLPDSGTSPENVGINNDEYTQRLKLAQEIQQVLADNRLVSERADAGPRQRFAATPGPPVTEIQESISPGYADADAGALDKLVLESHDYPTEEENENDYSQQVFDQLNEPKALFSTSASIAAATESGAAAGLARADEQRLNATADLADLNLDGTLQKKSEALERKESETRRQLVGRASSPARSKRVEQSALPETLPLPAMKNAGGKVDFAGLRISTFESEIDPYEFSLLDSGHLVVFRKVWRNGERYIQGLLIDKERFLKELIEDAFWPTPLWSMSTLVVAYQDIVLTTISGQLNSHYYPPVAAELDGTLLYQSALTAPLDGVSLIFSIDRLPSGPGARVLTWTTIVIFIVFLGGFLGLYRLGLSQINLARQQQDFVAAVSHELKTPLTSIRMYGEMLKEGWADEAKRQQYYGYIHDESERLTRLITNVLQLARITHNEPQFDKAPQPVGDLLSQIEAKIQTQVESAGFELAVARGPEIDAVMINIDADCFAQIIINLVDNAIKFSREAARKRIEIDCALTRDKTITFSIRDFGPGVPRDQMKKIFKLFYRSESELTRETVGTGIGLAIVHQLTTAMSGKVDVINKEPGAEFKLTFPLV